MVISYISRTSLQSKSSVTPMLRFYQLEATKQMKESHRVYCLYTLRRYRRPSALPRGEDDETHVMIFATKASIWKIFFDPIRILSSCHTHQPKPALSLTTNIVCGPMHDLRLEHIIHPIHQPICDRLEPISFTQPSITHLHDDGGRYAVRQQLINLPPDLQ